MSTRCQVLVYGNVESNDTFVNLYHHTDGYPSYMMPLIAKAHRAWLRSGRIDCIKGRAEHVAVFVAAADAECFEFDGRAFSGTKDKPTFHGDEEYIYIVNVDKDKWTVDIRRPVRGFWDAPHLSNTEAEASGVDAGKYVAKMRREEKKRKKLTETA